MLLALFAAGCSSLAARSAAPHMLLVTGGNELQTISTQDLQLRAQLRLPGPVVAAAMNPERNELLLATAGAQPYWLKIGSTGSRILQRRPLAMIPAAMVMHDRQGYLVGSNDTGSWVQAFDPAHWAAPWPLPGHAVALALTPQGVLAIAATQPSSLVLADPTTHRWRRVDLTSPPRQVVTLPYGHKVFVLCATTVAVIDTHIPGLLAYLPLGQQPQQMILKPDGGELYVSNAGGSVSVINTSANEVSGTIPAGLGAGAVAIGAAGLNLYVANAAAGTVTVISTAGRSVQAVIHVGQDPRALALGPDGLLLFAADAGSDDVAAVRAQDPTNPNSLITLLPSPPNPGYLTVLRP